MQSKAIRFLNADDGVADAVQVAQRFIAARGSNGTQRAIHEIASECRLRQTVIKSLLQPSRRPKSLSVGIWRQLSRTYLAFLHRKLGDLENEITRMEALVATDRGADPRLVDRAASLATRARDLQAAVLEMAPPAEAPRGETSGRE